MTEMVILIGCQGAGKTTFYRERFFRTHVRVSLDMLKTRHRERLLVAACLEMRQRFVVDNTNPTAADRSRYLAPARAARFRAVGYFFEAALHELLHRNARRKGDELIPEVGVRATLRKLEPPVCAEGFDELFRVRVMPDGGYDITPIGE